MPRRHGGGAVHRVGGQGTGETADDDRPAGRRVLTHRPHLVPDGHAGCGAHHDATADRTVDVPGALRVAAMTTSASLAGQQSMCTKASSSPSSGATVPSASTTSTVPNW